MSRERGSATLEMVIVMPAAVLMIGAIIMAGRMALAQQAVQAVAFDAARAASIARTADTANQDAKRVATLSFASNGPSCVASAVDVDTSGFGASVGSAATVTASVDCTVKLGDLSLPGVPGTVALTAKANSPIDPYRER